MAEPTGLMAPVEIYDPKYLNLIEITKRHEKAHWVEDEVKMSVDVEQWKNGKITEEERNLIKNILRLFTQSDMTVGSAYYDKLIPVIRNPEARQMLGSFAARECYSDDTEILTSSGWVLINDIDEEATVAQVDLGGNVSWANPSRVVSYPYVGDMHHYVGKNIDLLVTPEHELVLINPHTRKVRKGRSVDGVWGGNFLTFASGRVADDGALSPEDEALIRLLVAAQADGNFKCLAPWSMKNRPRTGRCYFALKKQRKVKRIIELVEIVSRKYDVAFIEPKQRKSGGITCSLVFPDFIDIETVKTFDCFSLDELSLSAAQVIVDELGFWDGSHQKGGSTMYYNSNVDAVNKVQAICAVSGHRAIVNSTLRPDVKICDNKEVSRNLKRSYAVSITQRSESAYPTKKTVPYSGNVYCVTVPHGNVIVRRNGRHCVSGNSTHIRGYALLSDTLGFGKDFYWEFLDYAEMREKHEYMAAEIGSSYTEFAEYLAKQVMIEGVSLFASFAMLFNFDRLGKLPGMCDVVRWSILDECYSDDTDILTTAGWKPFRALDPSDMVAQYHDDGVITWVTPERIVSYNYDGDMIHLHSPNGIDQLVTPNHRIISRYKPTGELHETTAEEFIPHYRRQIPVSGLIGDAAPVEFSAEERVLVAFQADGSVPAGKYRNGNLCGHRRVKFDLKKPRKVARLKMLLGQTEWEWDERPGSDGKTTISVNIPTDYTVSKDFEWIDLTLGKTYLSGFLEEVFEWDGSWVNEGYNVYTNTNSNAADKVQAAAVLVGCKAKLSTVDDNRSETYRQVNRLSINLDVASVGGGGISKTVEKYHGAVWCVTVPQGMVVVRRNGKPCVSGNSIHVEGIADLFRIFTSEHPRIVNDDFKRCIYDTARHLVDLEDAFIDKAFTLGGVSNLTPAEVKQYIRYVADYRLTQLGLKPNWHVTTNPLPWMDFMVAGRSFQNFFERAVTAYEKDTLTGDFEPAYNIYRKVSNDQTEPEGD